MDDTQAALAQICGKLRELAVPWVGHAPDFADPRGLNLQQQADPYSGLATLVGRWPPDSKGRGGGVTLNGDGSFFAEYDVLAWQGERFVEAVTAWGHPGRMRGEARMLDVRGEPVVVRGRA